MTKKADKIEVILNIIFKNKKELDISNANQENKSQDFGMKISRTEAKIILEGTGDDDIDMCLEKALEKKLDLVSSIIFALHTVSLEITDSEKDKIARSLDDEDDLSDTEDVGYQNQYKVEFADYLDFLQEKSENEETVTQSVGEDGSSVEGSLGNPQEADLVVLEKKGNPVAWKAEAEDEFWPSDEEGHKFDKVSQSSQSKPIVISADSVKELAVQPKQRSSSNSQNKPKRRGNKRQQRFQI